MNSINLTKEIVSKKVYLKNLIKISKRFFKYSINKNLYKYFEYEIKKIGEAKDYFRTIINKQKRAKFFMELF